MQKILIAFSLCVLMVSPGLAQNVSPIVAEAVIEAPLKNVWEAWVTSEGLERWLAPHAAIDLRLNGLMRSNYNLNATLDDPSTIENRIISFEPEKMLSIRVTKAPDNFPFPNAISEMWTVLYFEAVNTKQTKLRIVGLGFNLSDESQSMRKFFEQGNMTTLQQLQNYFSGQN